MTNIEAVEPKPEDRRRKPANRLLLLVGYLGVLVTSTWSTWTDDWKAGVTIALACAWTWVMARAWVLGRQR